MEEDDEVVLKNTGLYSHLLESGFDDFEFVENEYPSSFIQDSDELEIIEEDRPVQDYQEFEHQISAILDSNLVFNDDILFVKNFAVHMRPLTPSAVLSPACTEFSVGTAAVSTVCFVCFMCGVKLKRWMYFSLHLVPAGIYSAKYLYIVYCKRKRRKIVEKCLKHLKDLSLLVEKAIKFVHECEILAYSNWSSKMKSLPLNTQSYLGECEGMRHLRMSIFHAIRSAVLDLRSLVAILVNNFPLKAHVDNLNYHLAFLDEVDLHCAYSNENSISVQQLQKMKYVYLLLQSEFLRQLSLCFIPALWICNTDVLLRNTFTLLTHFSQRCLKRHQQLKSIFEIYYTFEKTDADEAKKVDAKWIYREAYVKLCSLSFNLQTVLRDSRHMEEFLEETRAANPNHDDVVHRLDVMSKQIGHDYERCKTVLEDLRKYVTSLKPKTPSSVVIIPSAVQPDSSVKTDVMLGVTDFSPSGPDEVFVGVSDDKVTEAETVDLEDSIKPACSKLLISELKVALQSKAKEWKERERVALKLKHIDADDEEVAEICAKENVSGDDDSGDELNVARKLKFSSEDADQYKFKPILTTESSFAKQIAKASESWGLKAEEFFDDDVE